MRIRHCCLHAVGRRAIGLRPINHCLQPRPRVIEPASPRIGHEGHRGGGGRGIYRRRDSAGPGLGAGQGHRDTTIRTGGSAFRYDRPAIGRERHRLTCQRVTMRIRHCCLHAVGRRAIGNCIIFYGIKACSWIVYTRTFCIRYKMNFCRFDGTTRSSKDGKSPSDGGNHLCHGTPLCVRCHSLHTFNSVVICHCENHLLVCYSIISTILDVCSHLHNRSFVCSGIVPLHHQFTINMNIRWEHSGRNQLWFRQGALLIFGCHTQGINIL